MFEDKDNYFLNPKTNKYEPINLLPSGGTKCLNCGKEVQFKNIIQHLNQHAAQQNQELRKKQKEGAFRGNNAVSKGNQTSKKTLGLDDEFEKTGKAASFVNENDTRTFYPAELPLGDGLKNDIGKPKRFRKKKFDNNGNVIEEQAESDLSQRGNFDPEDPLYEGTGSYPRTGGKKPIKGRVGEGKQGDEFENSTNESIYQEDHRDIMSTIHQYSIPENVGVQRNDYFEQIKLNTVRVSTNKKDIKIFEKSNSQALTARDNFVDVQKDFQKQDPTFSKHFNRSKYAITEIKQDELTAESEIDLTGNLNKNNNKNIVQVNEVSRLGASKAKRICTKENQVKRPEDQIGSGGYQPYGGQFGQFQPGQFGQIGQVGQFGPNGINGYNGEYGTYNQVGYGNRPQQSSCGGMSCYGNNNGGQNGQNYGPYVGQGNYNGQGYGNQMGQIQGQQSSCGGMSCFGHQNQGYGPYNNYGYYGGYNPNSYNSGRFSINKQTGLFGTLKGQLPYEHNHEFKDNICSCCGGFYCPECKSTIPPQYRRPLPVNNLEKSRQTMFKSPQKIEK